MNQRIDVRFVAVISRGDTPQDATRDARLKVGAIDKVEIAFERDTPVRRRHRCPVEQGELCGKHALQAAWAGREKMLGHLFRTAWRQRGK